jgi:hypothetical protein
MPTIFAPGLARASSKVLYPLPQPISKMVSLGVPQSPGSGGRTTQWKLNGSRELPDLSEDSLFRDRVWQVVKLLFDSGEYFFWLEILFDTMFVVIFC